MGIIKDIAEAIKEEADSYDGDIVYTHQELDDLLCTLIIALALELDQVNGNYDVSLLCQPAINAYKASPKWHL